MTETKLKIKSKQDFKGTSLCEAVLTAINELNFFKDSKKADNTGKQYTTFNRNVSYLASQDEINVAVVNHPEYSGNGAVEKCLNTFVKQKDVYQIGSGYMFRSIHPI